MLHIYYGDGKGKTTAGMGLCARAAGRGLRVLIYQFMKDNSTGERQTLALSEHITLMEGLPLEKFSFQLTAEEKRQRKAYYEEQFQKIVARSGEYDLLFFDELLYTIRADLFDEALLLDFLRWKPTDLEVVLTGQNPSTVLLEQANYVTEMKKVKHPFDLGVRARMGIER